MNVHFIKPMENLSVNKLPSGAGWTYEIKLDGFRVEAVRTSDQVVLYSRHGKLLTTQFPEIARELQKAMPPDTVLDGELVALDDKGRPRFNLLQDRARLLAEMWWFWSKYVRRQGSQTCQRRGGIGKRPGSMLHFSGPLRGR